MNKLEVSLENCFGIGKFIHVFDFAGIPTKTFLIYAPNGTMKTSFAKTLALIAKNDPKDTPCDKVHAHRVSVYSVLADGNPISPDSILVVNAEDNSFDGSSKISSFIARKELKEQYDTIYQELDSKKSEFIKKLKGISQSTDCESEVIATLQGHERDSFFEILLVNLSRLPIKPISYSFRYNDVFDKKGNVSKFLKKNQRLLDQYIAKYTEILSKSSFFKSSKNSFGTYQANEILSAIEDDSFFDAGHKFMLDGGKNISSSKALKDVVQDELNRIINDSELQTAFEKVDKEISNNAELRAFQKIIEKDNTLLVELKNYDDFKKKVWLDYLAQIKTDTEEFVEYYKSQKPAIEAILTEAKKEIAIWREIVEKFNSRFYVPFVVSIGNQEDVLLSQKTAVLEFSYDDNSDGPKIQDKDGLLKILSKGEQRAYFILQFLFEIESRKALGLNTLLVFDDVADSFDYKNKFAIVEYLKELNSSTNFKIIVLTHNFDFYRTVGSRLLLRTAIYMAVKRPNREIALLPGQYINGAFTHFITRFSEEIIFVSLLPFVRNLVEYTEGQSCAEYQKLTSCLHVKADTNTIDAAFLLSIYHSKLPRTATKTISFGVKNIKDLIYEIADNISTDPAADEVVLENKIALSMAIRLKAEEYMISKLPGFNLASITSNQTKALYDEFIKLPAQTKETLNTLDRVNLMTPENIHINAFMYEPLIDMTVLHLKELYIKANSLT